MKKPRHVRTLPMAPTKWKKVISSACAQPAVGKRRGGVTPEDGASSHQEGQKKTYLQAAEGAMVLENSHEKRLFLWPFAIADKRVKGGVMEIRAEKVKGECRIWRFPMERKNGRAGRPKPILGHGPGPASCMKEGQDEGTLTSD